jgi:hypothetical protein
MVEVLPMRRNCAHSKSAAFYDQLPSSFTEDALYDFIADRSVFSEEGAPISEWKIAPIDTKISGAIV